MNENKKKAKISKIIELLEKFLKKIKKVLVLFCGYGIINRR